MHKINDYIIYKHDVCIIKNIKNIEPINTADEIKEYIAKVINE